jgi:hypothetical protein
VVPERDRRHCRAPAAGSEVGRFSRLLLSIFRSFAFSFFLTQRCQQSETQQDLCNDNGHDAIRVATAGRLGVGRRRCRRLRLAVFAAAPPPQSPHDDRSAAVAAAASIPLRPSVLPIYWLVGRTVQAQASSVVAVVHLASGLRMIVIIDKDHVV